MNNKRQRNKLITMLMLVMALFIPQWSWAQTAVMPSVGDGSKDYPFEISTRDNLAWFRDWVNGTYTPADGETAVTHPFAYAKLTDNIDLENEPWTPIGGTDGRTCYGGVFDGNGKTVSNLNINAGYYAAFFATTKAATITNLTISNASVKGSDGTAVLVGVARNTTISGVRITDGSVTGGDYVGGIVAVLESSKLVNCQSQATVEGKNYVGGVVGKNQGSCIYNNVFTSGSVSCRGGIECGLLIGGVMDGTVRAAGLVAYDSEAKLISNGTELQGDNVLVIGAGGLAAGFVLACDKATLKSGAVAFMLQRKNYSNDVVWGQNLSADGGDEYPVLGSTSWVYADGDVRLSCEGQMSYSCTFSNEETEDGRLEMVHNGTSQYVAGKQATCTESGVLPHYKCSFCHGTFEDDFLTIDIPDVTEPASHKYGDGTYSWAESAEQGVPSATVAYTCQVCGTEKTAAMSVGFDFANKDVAATCTEVGSKNYKAAYKDAESGAYFCDTHSLTLPALGHDMATEVTFNADKEIYEKGCKHDCGLYEYFATSDGSVPATPNDDATTFTVEEFTLDDATAYDNKARFTVKELTYRRTFKNSGWQALYVPFDLYSGQISDDYELATINNFHEYEQVDGSTNVELEVKKVVVSNVIPALTPCLIRKKQVSDTEPDSPNTFRFADVAFAPAADKSIDCASVSRYYQFVGTLEEKSGFVEGTDFCMLKGELWPAGSSSRLSAQRWYLRTADRTGGLLAPTTPLSRIAIRVIGEGSATGIEDIRVVTDNGTADGGKQGIYDLQGRKLDKEPESGIYIKNGKKCVK